VNDVTEPTHPEDRTILAAVEALEGGSEAPGAPPRADLDDTTEETRARLYTEVLGLIPYELEPLQPSPGAWARVMALVQGDETQDVREPAPPTEPEPIRLTSMPGTPPVSVPDPESIRNVAPPDPPIRPAIPEVRPRPTLYTPPPRRARSSRWPLALAASLALIFAGLSSFLYVQLVQQRDTIDALGQQLDRESDRAASAVQQARQAQTDDLGLKEKFALVTSPAVEASPMRPAGSSPLQPAARGVLFVASDHQHWYLCLHGVAPAPEGRTYKLWFVADGVPVSGGTFTAQPGAPVELSSKQMPAGTKGVVVTMEADPETPKPAGPEVLRAAGVYQLS
jgi:hypothetical protein